MDPISAIANLASEVFEFINTKESRKYIDELVNRKQQLSDEQAKGDLSDDARIVWLYKRIGLIAEAALSDLRRLRNTKP